MTVDQLLQHIESLARAAREALQSGSQTVDLIPALQAADDAARADLAAAIQRAERRLAERRLAEREPASGFPGAISFQIDKD